MTARKKADQAEVKVPRVPRPLSGQVGEPDTAATDDRTLSPLGMYMKLGNISSTMMAKALGTSHKMVLEWKRGTIPELVMAYEIERVTKGAVPMESWLGMAKAKARMAAIRKKQPEEIQKLQPVREPGGFAEPPKVKRSVKKAVNTETEDES